MFKLGITGGIGSGKTTATSYLKKKHVFVFDADKEAKYHLQNSISLQHKISNAFGADLKIKPGSINLKELGRRAFLNKKEQSILNGIMWPEIYILIEKKIISVENKYKIFIVDAALIFEANLQNLFDEILLITADEEIRINRSSNRLNLPKTQIKNRLKLQIDEEKKKCLSNHVIENNGTIRELTKKLRIFYSEILRVKITSK